MYSKYIKSIYLFLSFICCTTYIVGQDVHFSQYNGSVLNLNPAFTGFFDGDYRANGIFRSQWSSVPIPYQSFSIAGDGRFKANNMKSDCFGIGIMFNNDKAGDTHYGTNQLYLSGAYMHKLNPDSTLLLSVGFNGGISNVGFNYSLMTFDNQYQNNSYSSANSTGESFAKTANTFGDFSFGAVVQYALKQRAYVQYGISYIHFTSPRLTFQNNNTIKIDPKLNNYLNFTYPVGATTDIVAELLFSNQGKYNEIIPGAQIKLRLDESKGQAISAGIYYRVKDAAIARVGYQIKTLTAGISYDVNTSKFIAATNRRGGFEIYLTYIFKKIVPFVPKTRVCPIYM